MAVPPEEGRGRQHHGRRAETALECAGLDKRLLDIAEFAVHGQALDGLDGDAVGISREHQAGRDRLPVREHHARSTLANPTALLGTGQREVFAQNLQQREPGVDGNLPLISVHDEVQDDHQAATRAPADSNAPCSARSVSTRARVVRYEALALMSPIGLASPLAVSAAAARSASLGTSN